MIIPELVRRELRTHVLGSLGAEVCGLLVGDGDELRYVPAKNCAPRPKDDFELDPWAWQRAEATGRPVTGIFHSHPSAPAEPSETDLQTMENTALGGLVWVIAGVRGGGRDELRGWNLDGEVPLV